MNLLILQLSLKTETARTWGPNARSCSFLEGFTTFYLKDV